MTPRWRYLVASAGRNSGSARVHAVVDPDLPGPTVCGFRPKDGDSWRNPRELYEAPQLAPRESHVLI